MLGLPWKKNRGDYTTERQCTIVIDIQYFRVLNPLSTFNVYNSLQVFPVNQRHAALILPFSNYNIVLRFFAVTKIFITLTPLPILNLCSTCVRHRGYWSNNAIVRYPCPMSDLPLKLYFISSPLLFSYHLLL